VDITDREGVDRALRGRRFDALIHLAAKAGVRPSLADPLSYIHTNILGTQSILDSARRLGVSRVILGSSSSVYGNSAAVPFREDDPCSDPISPYAMTKRAAELVARTDQLLHGGVVVCLRFFTVYGPRQRPDLAIRKFATLLLEGRPVPIYGDGSTERDYTWIDDIVSGVVGALEWSRERDNGFVIANLGGNKTTSVLKLVTLLSKSLGVPAKVQHEPFQPGDALRTHADLAKARELFGYEPRMPIELGIAEFARWFSVFEESIRQRAHTAR
jgi:UDP-glucuronate 4-epimerase